jgi:hypothetical protein
VIHKLEEHVACTKAFEQAIADHGWVLCRNEGTIEDATMQVISEIYRVLRCPVGEVRCAGLDAVGIPVDIDR